MTLSLALTLVVYTLLSVFGLYKIKAAANILSIPFIMGFFLYGSGFLIWLHMLRKYPLSLIFPLCSAGLLIGTLLAGWFLLHEHISLRSGAAVLLALGATILISFDLK
ncbi:hypothetical protein LJC15_03205 [Desulfovibrio sp. OttesenSCG-928-G11]|nr:hypothetical protein [Desulfovibrio sp. OttesenSCG-928-G11]